MRLLVTVESGILTSQARVPIFRRELARLQAEV